MLHLSNEVEIRSASACRNLCDSFASYFVSKIRNIKAAIQIRLANSQTDPLQSDPVYHGPLLSTLPAPSVDEVRKLICSMPAKSSPLDSIPTSVLKSCVELFAPLIARLAGLCFEEGVFPARYKMACVTPLLKKKGLDSDNVANYRPISNLHTTSKIVERLFMTRVIDHVERAPCFNRFQSAYRRGHSTETALLRTLNDVYCAADKKARTLLIQLDLSAAFDTIDQDTLLRRLEKHIRLVRFCDPLGPVIRMRPVTVRPCRRNAINDRRMRARNCTGIRPRTIVLHTVRRSDCQCHRLVQRETYAIRR